MLRAAGARIGKRIRTAQLVQLPLGQRVEDALAWYRGQPDVEYAEPNYRVHKAQTLTNDPLFEHQWGLRNTAQIVAGVSGVSGADISASMAWDQHKAGAIVAVVDTGVDYNHPDLAANIWSNPNEITGNGIDDDHNGYIDDIRGWNFAGRNNNPMDDDVDGHGSHVAGIIAAVGNNGIGVSGVNWSAPIMPLKFLDHNGDGTIADAAEAIIYAANHGARVINASYTYPQYCGTDTESITEREAIAYAGTKNAILVAAAGNFRCDTDRYSSYPGGYALDNLLSVGASDQKDGIVADFSNYGARTVHLFAPGDNILSTVRADLMGSTSHLLGYDYLSGTSMAAPMVSGALALLRGYRPDLSWKAAREIILKTVTLLPALDNKSVTGGRLNLANAMAFDLSSATPIQPSHFQAIKRSRYLVDLSWIDDSSIETQWIVERSENGTTFTEIARFPTTGALTVSYSDTRVDAIEGLGYSYRIRAANAQGSSSPTAVSTISSAIASPTGLTAEVKQGDSVRLNWQDHSERETSYRVERASGTGSFVEIATLAANTTTYTDTNLIMDRQYRYRVRAHSLAAGYSAYTSQVVVSLSSVSQAGDSGASNCLIATAAHGSSLQPKLALLRDFRDRHLKSTAAGAALVHAYYSISPTIARTIATSASLRWIVRAALWPVVSLLEYFITDTHAAERPDRTRDNAFALKNVFLVGFAAGISDDVARARLQHTGIKSIQHRFGSVYRIELPALVPQQDILGRIKQIKGVRYVEPDRDVRKARTPSAPLGNP